MKTSLKKIWLVALAISIPVCLIYAADTTLNMQVTSGTVSIWAPTSLTFVSTIAASDTTQSLEQPFTGWNYFFVSDLKGADAGWNTTLQLSSPLTAGSATIPTSNVSFKVNGAAPTLMSGSANPRVVFAWWTSAYQDFWSSRSFVIRTNAANAWIIGKYGAEMHIKIDVPAYQAVGSYTTTLVFTLIEN